MQNLLLHLGSPKSAAKVNRAQSAIESAVKCAGQQKRFRAAQTEKIRINLQK